MNEIAFGDCRTSMRRWIAEGVKVRTTVTSPPYFGLRDYGHPDQLGLEDTPEQYIANMLEVFRLVRDMTADNGTLSLNVGDSYARRGGTDKSVSPSAVVGSTINTLSQIGNRNQRAPVGTKTKDLLGIPWQLAIALRDDGAASPAHMRTIERIILAVTASYDSRDQWPERIAQEVESLQREYIDANRGGWYLRQDIIWSKTNPMPESVTDRCTKSHEYLFLFSKSEKYYFNNEAIKEPAVSTHLAGNRSHKMATAYEEGDEFHRTKSGLVAYCERQRSKRDSFKRDDSKRERAIPGQAYGTHRPEREESAWDIEMRNKRSVWPVAEEEWSQFQAWKASLAEEKGSVWSVATRPYKGAHFATFPPALIAPCILAGSAFGDIVFDPFVGSGTTPAEALRLRRQYLACEINETYKPLQDERRHIAIEAMLTEAFKAIREIERRPSTSVTHPQVIAV